jgi:glycosyltransferase involved in cell wall biosynthesis
MKVLQINATANTGSTGRIAEEIGLMFQKQGHESFIACKRVGPSGSTSQIIRIGNKFDEYMHGIKSRALDRHGFGSKQATKKLIEEIDRIDPDVIGLHNLHGYYLNIEVLFRYLKEVQKPVVWTFHDCWPFTGHCSFFDYVSCDKWKTECGKCPLYNRYPASWFMDCSTENFYQKRSLFNGLNNLTIVTPSQWLKNLVKQSFLSDYPVEVIHNGIDLDQFKSVDTANLISKHNLSNKKILIGVASVWDRRKGLDYFLELSKCLDDEFRIVLIGLSKEVIKKLPENIIGIQRTENVNELAAFYSLADVFVNPTLVDNFPTTNLEALACGTPVVTFNTGGSPEAISNDTGIVVGKGDLNGLVESIFKIIAFKRTLISSKCRERAVRYYNKIDRFGDYLQLYQRVTSNTKQVQYKIFPIF